MKTAENEDVAELRRAESRRKRQERKTAQQIAFKQGGWDRCMYRVPGRDRYCAQQRSPHSKEYCGTHMGENPASGKGKRVPCPVDPNHTVFEQQLTSHVKICNLALHEARMEQQPYYCKDINSGSGETRAQDGEHPDDYERSESEDVGRGDNVLEGGETTKEDATSARAIDEAFLLDVVARVEVAHRLHVGKIETRVLDPPEVQPIHRARVEGGTGFRKGRHVLQQASIVGHMLERGLVGPGAKQLHVEMGAGRGALGHAIATAFPGADITMIERSSVRRKAENRLVGGVSSRARVDIRHLNMGGLPSLNRDGEGDTRPVVAVAKHLCGAATDLALRAMLTLPPSAQRDTTTEEHTCNESDKDNEIIKKGSSTDLKATAVGTGDSGGSRGGGSSGRVGGLAIAMCCHHVCNWRDYVGREFLERLDFTPRDFEAMRRISAWISLEPNAGTRKNNDYPASCPSSQTPAAATGPGSSPLEVLRNGHEEAERDESDEGLHSKKGEEEHMTFLALTAAEKARAARQCKRLLDRGRAVFVEERLRLETAMVHFVAREITPENALLLGFRNK